MRRGRGWSCRSRARRSFGVGLARAVAAAGLTVIECEQPNRKARRGKGKSDPIDAHLAVLAALRLDADRLPLPRADGDREALRILLGARHELSVATTAQTNRLRALLLGGEDTERDLARATLTDPVLLTVARRREPRQASREQAVRHGEIRRLALAVRAGRHALAANRAQLQTIVDEMAPGLTERRGIGAVTAAQAIVSFSHPGRCRNDAAFAALSGTSPLPASSGKNGPASAQPRRRPSPELRHPHHRHDPHAVLPDTKDYVARRRAEGKSSREIQRCLKRYIARELYRALNASTTLTAQTSAAPAAA